MLSEDSLSLRHTPITKPSARRHPPPWHLSTTGNAEVPPPSETVREKGQKRGKKISAYPVQTLKPVAVEDGGWVNLNHQAAPTAGPSDVCSTRRVRTNSSGVVRPIQLSSGYSFFDPNFTKIACSLLPVLFTIALCSRPDSCVGAITLSLEPSTTFVRGRAWPDTCA